MIRARFFSLDANEDLLLTLRALGFPGAAANFLAGSLPQGHLVLSGLGAELAELVRVTCGGRERMPKILEGDQPGAMLLSGRLDGHRQLGDLLQKRADVPGAPEAGGKMLRACFHAGHRDTVRIGNLVAGGSRTLVMGIVNVTPDSFSDGGRYTSVDAALAHARLLAEAGADILDVGGESTRPKGIYGEGARPLAAAEERSRVEPVVRAIARELPGVAISVDTSKAEVAEAAVGAGAVLVNDVRGLADPALAALVRVNPDVACCVMHMPAEPDTMAENTGYEDVVGEVADGLNELVAQAQANGIPPARILVDPGIGFGKSYGQNLFLLRQLSLLRSSVGRPLLVGTSRKGFLGHVTGRPVEERDAATAASVVAAVLGGASVVRVHDVAACRDAVQVADAVARADEGGAWFTRGDDGWD